MNILIVDDEPVMRKVLRRLLRDHDVTEAPDVGAAKQILGLGLKVHLVLSDVMMPEETGADLHRWILENRPNLASHFAFMTGGIRDDRVKEYVADAGVPVLAKPFTPSEIEDLLAGFDS